MIIIFKQLGANNFFLTVVPKFCETHTFSRKHYEKTDLNTEKKIKIRIS